MGPGRVAAGDAGAVERFLAAQRAFESEAPANGRDWVRPLRRAAAERFAASGFPTTKEEAWRFTSVAPIARTPFAPARGGRTEGLTREVLERLTFQPWECSHLVFLNGRHLPALSRLRPLPPGVIVASLGQALQTHRALVEPHLARHADGGQPFAALNTAFLEDGAFVSLPPGATLDEPIHLLFVSTEEDAPTMAHPRVLVVAGAGARAAIVESHAGVGEHLYLTNAVTEIVAGDGAILDHLRVQRESGRAYHIGTVQAVLGRDARLVSHSVSLGGALVRNDIGAALSGEGADCVLNGLYVASGAQHVDNHTTIDHLSPHGTSRELYKGVLDGGARGVFDGRIIVRADARKTDARQENRNLLLSEEALVDTRPTLQILNDDVKCSHAATIGRLDEDQLFYLRSRGIGDETARSLLIHAFVSEIVSRMRFDPVRVGLDCLLFTRLPRHHGARA